jgi:hypothetical protein
MIRHSGKLWTFLCLREASILAPSEWQITITQWSSGVPALTQSSGGSSTGRLGG